jgi:hypothetical protein
MKKKEENFKLHLIKYFYETPVYCIFFIYFIGFKSTKPNLA